MNTQTLAFFACHSSARDMVTRHLPFWQANADHVRLSFSDSIEGFPHAHLIGPEGHCGHASIARMKGVFRQAFREAIALDCGVVIVGESDTVLFRRPPETREGVMYAPVHRNTEPHRFKHPLYVHPVIRLTVRSLGYLIDELLRLPDTSEEGFGDRVLPLAADYAGLEVQDDQKTYSRNSLDTPDYIAGAQECLQKGGYGIHGIKTEPQLAACIIGGTMKPVFDAFAQGFGVTQ